jgi:hypothetical protein
MIPLFLPISVRIIICAAILAMCGIAGSKSLLAQERACAGSDITRATLTTIKAANKETQARAAITFVQNWSSSLPDLMREIAEIKPSRLNSQPAEKQWAMFVIDLVRTMLATNDQAIRLFRLCPDRREAIKVLAWVTRGDDIAVRRNAANILANAVDNTTVCFVIHHLRDSTLNTPGRANLLGVTRAMASYAYKENVVAISAAVALIEKNLEKSPEELSQTRSIIVDINDRLKKSQNAETLIPVALKDFCKEYEYTDRPDPI